MVDLVTAILLAVASFAICVRQIVLSPNNGTFPPAPQAVRVGMFIFGAVLAYSAVLFFGASPQGGAYAGQAGLLVLLMASGLCFYNVIMLVNLMRQRYPAPVWRRLNHAAKVVRDSCPEKKAAFPAPVHVRPK